MACRKKGKKAAKEEAAPAAAAVNTDELGKEVETMPQFAALGARFRSCPPVALTEEGLEYVVTCVKHIFDTHVVLQFNCTNTYKAQVRRRAWRLAATLMFRATSRCAAEWHQLELRSSLTLQHAVHHIALQQHERS